MRLTVLPRWRDDISVEDPGVATPGFLRFARRFIAPIVHASHRPTLEGAEHLPSSGPYMLVANHSAGMAVAEILTFITLYLEHVGAERPLAGFAHPLGFRFFPASTVLRGVGAIPSTFAAAESTLARGTPILVFPGGEWESMRPVWQAHRVDFGGRLGFLKIARKMRVPIVPMGIRGSHFTAPMLWRSRFLAWALILPRLVGLKRWPMSLLGLIVALVIVFVPSWAWYWRALATFAWLNSPFVFTSWIPSTIHMRIGKAIPPDELAAEPLDVALARVEGEVQRLVARRRDHQR